MKKYFWLIAFFITFIACSKPADKSPDPTTPVDPPVTPNNPVNEVSGRISIFSKSQKFVIYLSGKNVTVNWGAAGSHTYAKLDSTVAITQNYISSVHDTLVITGTNITYLKCSGNNLLTVNVSANPALTWLDCSANSLDSLNLQGNCTVVTTCGSLL